MPVLLRSVAALVSLTAAVVACASTDPSSAEGELTQCPIAAKLDAKGVCRVGGAFAAKRCCETEAPTTRRNLDGFTCPKKDVKVAFFDADSTLRVSKSGSVSANGLKDVNVLPFAALRIAELNADGHLVAIVSNQGGVASKQITLAVAEGALVFTAQQLAKLGARIDYIDFAEAKDGFRKPEIGMATKLGEILEAKCGVSVDLSASLMIGDSGYKKGVDGKHPDGRPADDFSNADRLFAENLGVPFSEPTDAFGWRAFDVFNIENQAELVEFLSRIDTEIAELKASGKDATRRKALEREVEGIRTVNGL